MNKSVIIDRDSRSQTSLNSLDSSQQISENRLTIYSRSGHFVQKFQHGTESVILPRSAEISSIVAIDINGKVIPFSYVPESTMGIALTDRSTGEKVEAAVTKDGQTIKGKIITLSSDNITLRTNNQIINVKDYDTIIVNISDDFTRPRLILLNNSAPFTLSYLVSNISWRCVGTALVDKINNMMHLRLAGDISNKTEGDITADTILVNGDVYQNRYQDGYQDRTYESQSFAPRASLKAASPMSSEKVQTSMSEDYTKYNVGNRVIHNKDIAELGTWSFPINKLYIHNTNEKDTVRFGYRIIAPEFIPSCSVNVYSVDENKMIDSYLGSDTIDESQANDEVDIILGESTLLQCESLVIINDIIIDDESGARKYGLPLETFNKREMRRSGSWHIIIEDITIDITNHNMTASSLLIKHYIGDKRIVGSKCEDYIRNGDHIEWYFQVPPKQGTGPRKDKFVCQIKTASYY